MIEIFEGRLGGGKTYSAVLRIAEALSKDATIFTNVALHKDKLYDWVERKYQVRPDDGQLTVLTEDQIADFQQHTPPNCFIVIDEIHLWLNARDFGSNWAKHRELFEWLTQSRKSNNDVLLISQSLHNIDKQCQRLVQYIWRFRDMRRFKIPGLGIRWPLPQLLQVQYDYDGKTALRKTWLLWDKSVYELYETAATYKTNYERRAEVQRGKAVAVKPTKGKRMLRIALCVLALAVGAFLMVRSWGRFTGGTKSPDNPFRDVASVSGKVQDFPQAARVLRGLTPGGPGFGPVAVFSDCSLDLGDATPDGWRFVGVRGAVVSLRKGEEYEYHKLPKAW